MKRKFYVIIVLIAALLAAGCSHGSSGSPSSPAYTPSSPTPPSGPVTKEVSSSNLESVVSTLEPDQEYIIKITDESLNNEALADITTALAEHGDCQISLDLTCCTGLTTIENNAFKDCTVLTGITLPEGVTTISANAFSGCTNLTSITISDKVTSISEEAFTGCTELTEFTVKMTAETLNLAALPNIIGYNINLDVSNCTDFTSLTANTLSSYTSITGFILPIEKLSTVASALGSTKEYNIKITDIEPSLSVIKPNITGHKVSLDLSECSGITTIEASTFKNCTGLTGITLPGSVISIGEHAFDNCSELTSVTIPDSVTTIGNGAFLDCDRLEEVHISNLETWMNINFENFSSNPLYNAHHLFIAGTEVTELEIPSTVTSVSYSAFFGCSGLTSVTIPDSVTTIGNGAFGKCSGLTSVTIPNSVTSIGNSAFIDCSRLTSVTIPDSVTSIGDHAFSRCTNLTNATIPNSVTSIDRFAFSDCSELTGITFSDTSTWYRKTSSSADNSTATKVNVSDPAQNATRLKGTLGYYNYYWYKIDEPAEE